MANKVAHANDRLIMFANAQAEEIYNHGYPLIFGVGTASTPVGRLLFSPLVEPCCVLCCVALCGPGTSAYHYVDPAVYYLRMRGARTAALLYSKAAFTSSVAQGALNSLVASGAVLEASSVLSFAEVSPSRHIPFHDLPLNTNPPSSPALVLMPRAPSMTPQPSSTCE